MSNDYKFFTSTFVFFGQRLHQFHSLEEIAVYLQRGLVKVDDWKDFMSNLCCESYPDPELHEQEISSLE